MSKAKSIDLGPEAGGNPVRLVTAAAEYVRAANHATFDRRPVPGLASGSDAYDTVGALDTLASRLPQLCDQLAYVLQVAGENGTLTGPKRAPRQAAAELHQAAAELHQAAAELHQAAAELHQAADAFRSAHDVLNRAWQTLSPVGGWLSADGEG